MIQAIFLCGSVSLHNRSSHTCFRWPFDSSQPLAESLLVESCGNQTTVVIFCCNCKNLCCCMKGASLFSDLFYLEYFVLITSGFHPFEALNDHEQCMYKVSCTGLFLKFDTDR